MKKKKAIFGNYLWGLFLSCLLMGVSFEALAQEIQIRGTITDTSGEPLPGASVVEMGTSNGVITDVDGRYAISAKANSILVTLLLE